MHMEYSETEYFAAVGIAFHTPCFFFRGRIREKDMKRIVKTTSTSSLSHVLVFSPELSGQEQVDMYRIYCNHTRVSLSKRALRQEQANYSVLKNSNHDSQKDEKRKNTLPDA